MILSGKRLGDSWDINKEGTAKKSDIKDNLSGDNLDKYMQKNTCKRSRIIACSVVKNGILLEDEDGDIHIMSIGSMTRSGMFSDPYTILDIFGTKDIDFESEITENDDDGLFSPIPNHHPRIQKYLDVMKDGGDISKENPSEMLDHVYNF